MNSLEWLKQAIPEWVTIIEEMITADCLCVNCSIVLPNHAKRVFKLEVSLKPNLKDTIQVREIEQERTLPIWCAERHINFGGFFCLGWHPDGPRPINDSVTATTWWNELAGFLEAQCLADEVGVWPVGKGWPHGDAAAKQYQYEELVNNNPSGLRTAVEQGKVQLAFDKKKLLNRKRPCPCGKGYPIKRCCEAVLAEMLILHKEVARLEEEFWKSARQNGLACCGTMKACKLSKIVPISRIS